ncbi:hypothetical protein [Acetohalobium arabaticum]|uniref:Uncharacterized protein n=1 Tax=Acetohalobium arabaticum (strain ATCC 49924 / DSM 5501 / Z-7288) TaxID=574087 RepID=D9QSG7_ACEAZ|nr:hypothetical protein [Acetohalobium arabaticum]ADL13430.1 hypothetical protein Acear_1929 [Acetohalobium arabaticum DSM 5501]
MQQTQLILSIFQFILEGIALSFSTAIFLKIKIDNKKILIIGLISALLGFFFRKLPIVFGFHSILSILLFTILLNLFYKKEIVKCFIAVAKAFILLSVFEILTGNIFIYLTNKTVKEIINNPYLKTLAVLPQSILLFLLGFIMLQIRKRRDKVEL